MNPPKKPSLPYRWKRRAYLLGCLLCVCMLSALGLWIFFLIPDDTPDIWPTETAPLAEERTGYSGGHARTAPSFPSNGEPHNEGMPQRDALISDQAEPPQIASAAWIKPKRARDARDSNATLAAPLNTLASATLSNTEVPPRPIPVKPAAMPESGLGEITILALAPGAHVNVADHVVTEAPTTVRVPWPANYTVAFHVDEAKVYETQVHLSAENNKLSLALDPGVGID